MTFNKAIHLRGSWGPGPYVASAVHFDGATGLTAADSTGWTDTNSMIFSLWLKNTGAAGNANARLFSDQGARIAMIYAQGGGSSWEFSAWSPGYADLIWDFKGPATSDNTSWHHYLMSTNGTAKHFYIDGVDVSGTALAFSVLSTPQMTETSYNTWDIGDAGGNFFFTGDIADLYFAPNQYLDLSVQANREKFILAGAPVDLGATGTNPTGSQPMWCFTGNASAFVTNKGNGLNLSTSAGTLTTAGTHP